MAALGQTISVIDRSGKVVSTSKHLYGVFKEAKCAYQERKADVKAQRHAKHLAHDDSRSAATSRRHVSRSKSVARHGDHHEPRSHHRRSHSHDSAPEEKDLKGLVGKVRMVLDEAGCAQHSATAIMKHLQEKPEAMAAVALTLAEISTMITKVAPAALPALKASAPAVFALLASPQFMIAAGVGLGVTIVMFGGYKVIKQIKAKQSENSKQPQDMIELNSSAGRVESWRRGVAESEADTVGPSVDGEFITPTAAAMSRHHPPRRVSEVQEADRGSEYSRHTRSSRESRESEPRSERSSKKKRDEKKDKEREREKKKEKKKEKTKKPSPLRRLLDLKH